MAEVPLPDAKAWMTKALHDLEVAQFVANATVPFLDVAIYHCQQAGKKALKAFLVHHSQPVEKTHDLEVLVALAADIEPEMNQLIDAADALTPYVSRFR